MPDVPTLTLGGDVTIGTIAEAHQQLAFALSNTRELHIDLQGVTQADLTLVQLLLSARHTANRDGKGIYLTQPLPDVLMSEVVRGGFSNSDDVFWTKHG